MHCLIMLLVSSPQVWPCRLTVDAHEMYTRRHAGVNEGGGSHAPSSGFNWFKGSDACLTLIFSGQRVKSVSMRAVEEVRFESVC